SEASHRTLLEKGKETISTAWHFPRSGETLASGRVSIAGTNLHSKKSPVAVVDAPVHLLGMPSGRSDHLSSGVRLDPFRFRPRRSDDLCDLSLRFPGRFHSGSYVLFVVHLSRPGHRGCTGSGRGRPVFVASAS